MNAQICLIQHDIDDLLKYNPYGTSFLKKMYKNMILLEYIKQMNIIIFK